MPLITRAVKEIMVRCSDWFILERVEGCGARAEGKGKYGIGLILNPTQAHNIYRQL
jgi:hypothetical protein